MTFILFAFITSCGRGDNRIMAGSSRRCSSVSPSTGNGTKCQLLKKFALNLRFRQKWKAQPAALMEGFTPFKTLAWNRTMAGRSRRCSSSIPTPCSPSSPSSRFCPLPHEVAKANRIKGTFRDLYQNGGRSALSAG